MAQAEYPKFLMVSNSRGRQPPQIAALPVCPLEINSKSLGLADELSVLHPSICHENVNSASSLCNVEPSQLGSRVAAGEELRVVPRLGEPDFFALARGSTRPDRLADADLPRMTKDQPIWPLWAAMLEYSREVDG
jgi:hypothetical protein